MKLNISSVERCEEFNCTKHFWANVPLEIYFSSERNKLLTISDGDLTVWQASEGTFCKFLYAYGNSKEVTLLQLIIVLPNLTHQRLYYCKYNNSTNFAAVTAAINSSTGEGASVISAASNTLNSTVKVSGEGATTVSAAPNTNTVESTMDNTVGDGIKNNPTLMENIMGNSVKSWKEVSRDELYDEISNLSEKLPSNESEMERWTRNSNFHLFVPKEKPKYFAVDLDRTFLIHNSQKMIENVKSFEHLRENGFVPFFCTGRSHQCAFDGFNEIMSEYSTYEGYPGVYNNGAVVFDSNGSLIYSNSFSQDYMRKLVNYITENHLEEYFLFHDVGDFYSLTDPNFLTSKLFLFYEYLVPKVITPEELITKQVVMIYFGKYAVEFGGFVNGVDHVGKFTLYELFAEIVPPKTSKCSGVKLIMEHYKLNSDELYFVGDGENDIEIMQMLENSFAVLNAPDRVKKYAKYTLPQTHDHNAVKYLFNTIYQ